METPTLDLVILQGIESRLFDVHTCLPGIVEKYNKAKNTVDVIPALKRKYETGEVVQQPMILNVPVQFPRGGNFSMTFPIKKGDSVVLVFSERSLDVWKKNGGIVDPKDPRKFNITDAFAIPGGYPESNPVGDASDESLRVKNKNTLIELTEEVVRIKNGTGLIEIGTGAKFKIQKEGGDDFLALMSDFLQEIIDARTMTAMGPQPFIDLSPFIQLKTKLDAIKGS